MIVRYLTHPQVAIDPDRAVTEWSLSVEGRNRVEALAKSGALAGTARIVSSAERKALETAAPLAAVLGLTVEIRAAMHENDRSATAYLREKEFEATADAFFAYPAVSIRGWETAAAAQSRIVAEVESVLADTDPGTLLLVGHGAVGTLLYCHWAGLPISRIHDQMSGGGCFWTLDATAGHPLHGWLPMEEMPQFGRT